MATQLGTWKWMLLDDALSLTHLGAKSQGRWRLEPASEDENYHIGAKNLGATKYVRGVRIGTHPVRRPGRVLCAFVCSTLCLIFNIESTEAVPHSLA